MIDLKKCFLLFFIVCLMGTSAMAQTPSYRWEAGIKAKHKLNEKSSLGFNVVNRQTFNEYGKEQIQRYTDKIELKAGYYYALKPKLKIGLAYMYRSNDPFEDNRSSENRIIQQLTYLTSFLLPIDHRLRITERIYEKAVVLRLRYRLKYKGAFLGDKVEKNSLYYTLSDELLLSYHKEWSGQNRLGLGLGYLFKNESSLELGLSHRYKDVLAEKRNNALQLMSSYSFKF